MHYMGEIICFSHKNLDKNLQYNAMMFYVYDIQYHLCQKNVIQDLLFVIQYSCSCTQISMNFFIQGT